MSLSNPGALFVVCALCLLVAEGIARRSGFYREQLAAGGGRFESIDGLRSFLALGMASYSIYLTHCIVRTGTSNFRSFARRQSKTRTGETHGHDA